MDCLDMDHVLIKMTRKKDIKETGIEELQQQNPPLKAFEAVDNNGILTISLEEVSIFFDVNPNIDKTNQLFDISKQVSSIQTRSCWTNNITQIWVV